MVLITRSFCLEKAGVDLTTPEPIEKAVAVFDEAVAEMEVIAQSEAFTNPVLGRSIAADGSLCQNGSIRTIGLFGK